MISYQEWSSKAIQRNTSTSLTENCESHRVKCKVSRHHLCTIFSTTIDTLNLSSV